MQENHRKTPWRGTADTFGGCDRGRPVMAVRVGRADPASGIGRASAGRPAHGPHKGHLAAGQLSLTGAGNC